MIDITEVRTGTRVRLTQSIPIGDDFGGIPPGTCGVIEVLEPGVGFAILVDEVHDSLREWDNRIEVWVDHDYGQWKNLVLRAIELA